MNLTKNQIYIVSAIVILVVAYFLFFRKKGNAEMAAKMATPPAPTPPATGTPAEGAESGWSGAYGYNSMPALSGNYNPYYMLNGKESGYAKGSGNVVIPSNTGVPGIDPNLELGAKLGAGDWRGSFVNGGFAG